MALELTDDIGRWLDNYTISADYAKRGAELLLRVSRNRILYDNTMRFPLRLIERVRFELKRIYDSRMKLKSIEQTKRELAVMMPKVEEISVRLNSSSPDPKRFRHGKRIDHDSLPPEIAKIFDENMDLLHRIRECHTRLRLVSPDNSSCPDSDRYPWAKEIIRLDKIYRENWRKYDSYGYSDADAPTSRDELSVRSRRAVALINLNLRKYSRTHDTALRDNLRRWYQDVVNPSDTLTARLVKEGVISA